MSRGLRPSYPDAPLALDGYRTIQQLAELELELAGKGALDALESLAGRWQALTAELPDRPPPAARPLLERATLLHERARIELLRLREALLSDIASARRAARAADGYAPSSGRRVRLDRSA